MSPLPSAVETFNREFLFIRTRLLDLAAALDRVDRAEGTVTDDPRLQRIHEAITVLASEDANRAEQVQMVFSGEP